MREWFLEARKRLLERYYDDTHNAVSGLIYGLSSDIVDALVKTVDAFARFEECQKWHRPKLVIWLGEPAGERGAAGKLLSLDLRRVLLEEAMAEATENADACERYANWLRRIANEVDRQSRKRIKLYGQAPER